MYHRLSDVTINKLGLLLSGSWAVPFAANPVQQPVSYLQGKHLQRDTFVFLTKEYSVLANIVYSCFRSSCQH